MESMYKTKMYSKLSVHQSSHLLADITAEHTCGVLSTMESKYSSYSSFQVSCKSSHKCVALGGCCAFNLLPSSSQTSLIVFESGDWAGHVFSRFPFCSFLLRQFWHGLNLCFESSCCRMNSLTNQAHTRVCNHF